MNATRMSIHRPGTRGPDPRRRRHRLRAALAGIAALALVAIAAPAASAAPWTCSSFGYLFQSPNEVDPFAPPHDMIQVDLATGQQIDIGDTPNATNGIGFNELDNFIYGIQAVRTGPSTSTWSLVRVHSDGSIDDLGQPTGPGGSMNPLANYAIGDVDPNGHYWTIHNSTRTWYEVDLTTPTPTLLQQGTFTLPAGVAQTGNDWSWIDGALYSVGQNAGATESYLLRFTPATGFQRVGTVPVPGGGIGATFADSTYLYASQNATGIVYRIDPRTLQTIEASEGNPSVGNDGARCAAAPIPTITVTKTVGARVRSADQFTVGLVEDTGRTLDSATTSGSGMTASTVNWPVSQGHTYTITDAMAAGSPTPIGEYVQSIACTDADGNPVATGGTAGNWTLTAAAATFYTCDVSNRASADLSIVKSAMQSPIVPGQSAGFTFVATNNGPSTASNVTVTDQLPAQFRFVSASAGCDEAGGRLTCAVPELAPGAVQTFTVTGRVASSLDQCLANAATVTSATPDPNAANDRSDICTPIKPESGLAITKTPSRTELPAGGGQVMYTLVVENLGPSDDPGVEVRDALAPGLRLLSARPSQGRCSTAGGRVDCDLGALRAGGSAQVLVTVDVAGTPGCITNTATADGTRGASRQASATVCVPPGPVPPPAPPFDLQVDKTANVKRPAIGQRVTYRIVVRNNGPAAAPDVVVTDTLNRPSGVVSVRASAGTCDRALPLDCRLGTIQPGGRVTITVVVTPREAGCRQRNAASAVGSGTDAKPANNMDVVDRCVTKIPLRLTKVSDRQSVRAGQTFGYTLRVANPTSGVARDVRVCDELPAGLVYVGSQPRARLSRGRHCWTIGRLGPKASRTFRVTVRALPGAAGDLVNRATASSPDAKATARARRTVEVVAGQVAGGGVTG